MSEINRPMPAVAERTVNLTGHDQYLFREGTHSRLYEKLGAHFLGDATHFAVWAPNAVSVAVVGDWNGWDSRTHPMKATGDSGIWQLRVPEAKPGSVYKFHIVSRNAGYKVDKADPYAFRAEEPPRTGSMVWDLSYEWHDGAWMADRKYRNALDAPWSVYEVHLGSWRRSPDDPGSVLGYRDLAPQLADYCRKQGFAHVELLPIMEHPFYGSWGYQTTGYFAPSNRYGTPQDFMSFVDTLHQAGVGVILDWVPSHFPWDQHGLGFFDGSHLFEHADPRQGHHPDWASAIFNYGRNEVRAFLASSARFWLDKYRHDELTFSLWYAFHENFVLPLSHDEVVHGKGSLIGRMPGDGWQQFANLRALFGYMWSHPGKKLLFMGGEFGQRREWTHDDSLEWHVMQMDPRHEGVQKWLADLNRVLREQPALHQKDFVNDGFRWVQRGDWEQSVLSFLRLGKETTPPILVVCNFTPVPRYNYRLGVPRGGYWRELLNSDSPLYGGSGLGNYGGCDATPMPYEQYSHSLSITVPPLAALFFKPE